MGSCKHDKEAWSPLKRVEFHYQLRDCWLLKMILLHKVNSGSRKELFIRSGEADGFSYIRGVS